MLLLAFGATGSWAGETTGTPLRQGDALRVGTHEGVVTRLDTLPYVQSEYAKRFRFDSYDNPRLRELRDQYRLDEVVSGGKDEFDRQVLLLDWVNHQFKKFGRPTSPARGALDILRAIPTGNAFFCSHYGDVMVSAAASLGWVDRPLCLRRPDNIGQGSTEHTSTEIWSNQYRKWIMLDPTFAMYVEKDGVPLNAFELRQEWFYHDGKDLVFVLDKDRKRYRKSDLPVFRNRYEGFGDLSLDASALNPYAFIGYVPNTNLMDRGLDYGRMFIVQDRLCDGTQWHKRLVPSNPASDPYFPIGQAAMTPLENGAGLRVELKTFTPNFKAYLARIDDGPWKPAGNSFLWELHGGANRLQVKTVNLFGIEGPLSTAEVRLEEPLLPAGVQLLFVPIAMDGRRGGTVSCRPLEARIGSSDSPHSDPLAGSRRFRSLLPEGEGDGVLLWGCNTWPASSSRCCRVWTFTS